MTALRSILFLIVLALGASPSAHAQPSDDASGDAVLQRVQDTYNALESLRGTFTQTVMPSFTTDSTQIRGELLLQGNRYRMETRRETLVTNGTTTWIYAPADSQVIVNHASDDPSTVSPQTLFMDYADDYTVTDVRTTVHRGASHRVLTLDPTENGARFQSIRLWVRERDALITRLRVVDTNDATIQIAFDDLEVNPPVQASDFTFTPPPGVDVVDLRSS